MFSSLIKFTTLLLASSNLVSAQTLTWSAANGLAVAGVVSMFGTTLPVSNCPPGIPYVIATASNGLVVVAETVIVNNVVLPSSVSLTYQGQVYEIVNIQTTPVVSQGSLSNLLASSGTSGGALNIGFTNSGTMVFSQGGFTLTGFTISGGTALDLGLLCNSYSLGQPVPVTTSTKTVLSPTTIAATTTTKLATATVIEVLKPVTVVTSTLVSTSYTTSFSTITPGP